MTNDTCCSLAPFFAVPETRLGEFKRLVDRFVDTTATEKGCLYYGFCFDGNTARCREGYVDADALLVHLDNVGELLAEAQEMAPITRLEVYGPEAELAKLREPLAALDADFYVLETGFRR